MLKVIIIAMLTLMLTGLAELLEARRSGGGHGRSGGYRSYSGYRSHSARSYKTRYISGKSYKTTGKPMVKRSESAKKAFLKSKGLKKIPKGYEIDHIIPLSKGGRDEPSNMQLISKSSHHQKTAKERKKH